MSEPLRELIAATAALLDQHRRIDGVSRAFTAAGCVTILIGQTVISPPRWTVVAAAIVVLAGLAEAYFAIRIGFDAALFQRVANTPGRVDFGPMDAALMRLGFRADTGSSRPVDSRIAGTMRLFWLQTVALGMQVLAVLAAAATELTRN